MNIGEKRVRRFFKGLGYTIIKLPTFKKGIPDFLVWKCGHLVGAFFIEVKSSGQKHRNKPLKSMFTDEQLSFLSINNSISLVAFVNTNKKNKGSINFYRFCNTTKFKLDFVKDSIFK